MPVSHIPVRMTNPPNANVPGVRGIYRIYCFPMRRAYIGQAADMASRFLQHQTHLLRGEHSNRALQAAFNRYGPSAFTFQIVEVVAKGHDLTLAEQRWMDKERARTFNVRPAGSDEELLQRLLRAAPDAAVKAAVWCLNRPSERAPRASCTCAHCQYMRGHARHR